MPKPTATVIDIKRKVQKYQGRKVHLEAHKSKKKLYQKTGFIDSIYPKVFTISIESDKEDQYSRTQVMSFSYIDLLTNNVKIDLVDSADGNISL